MVRSEEHQAHKSSLSHKLWVWNDVSKTAAQHIKSSDYVLPLGLTFVLFHPGHKSFHLLETFLLDSLLLHTPLFKCLLLQTGFELVFVLHSLTLHLFLAGDWIFVQGSSLLAHLFFLSQLLLVPLQFQLYLVLSLSLGHLDFELLRFSFLVLCNLDLRDGKFPINSKMVKRFTLCSLAAQDALFPRSSSQAQMPSLRFDFHQGI